MGGHKPKAIRGEHEAFFWQRIRQGAFTLRGLVAELAARGLKADYTAVWKFVHAEKLSFKKNRFGQRAGSSRRGAAASAVEGASGPDRAGPAWSSSTRPGPRPTWRRCGDGYRSAAGFAPKVPHGQWKTMTFLAALRHDRIDAPWLLDGPINGESFKPMSRSVLRPDASAGRHCH